MSELDPRIAYTMEISRLVDLAARVPDNVQIEALASLLQDVVSAQVYSDVTPRELLFEFTEVDTRVTRTWEDDPNHKEEVGHKLQVVRDLTASALEHVSV